MSPPWVVLKFGGTSVSSAERWQTIAAIISERVDCGERPLVVCSAVSGVSNLLEAALAAAGARGDWRVRVAAVRGRHDQLCADLGIAAGLIADELAELERTLLGASLVEEVSPRVHARVMALGEVMSTKIGAAWLERRGVGVRWVDARDLLGTVDEPRVPEVLRYLSATCSTDRDPGLTARLDAIPQAVLLTQGFIARTPDGHTALLGRGGSDTSAAYLAAAIGADRCEIWTDVPGMFTTNPHLVPSARLLATLDYDEAQEIASTGARVLHPRCLAPARRHRIPMHVRCTPHPHLPGTVISSEPAVFSPDVKAISARSGLTLISMETVGMWQQVGFLADVFACFKARGLSVDLVSTSESNVTVSLDPTANALDPEVIDRLLDDLSPLCAARAIDRCAAVSLVGRQIRAMLHRLGPALEVFEEQEIHLVSQASSDLNLTFVVGDDQAERLVRRLHAMLFPPSSSRPGLGPSWQELFDPKPSDEPAPVAPRRPWWQIRAADLLAVARHTTPAYVYDEATLDAGVASLRSLTAVDRVFYAIKANSNPAILQRFAAAGLGLECVSPGELRQVAQSVPGLPGDRILYTPNFAPRADYEAGFAAGAHVTLDNLHPLEAWPDLFEGRDVLLRIDPGQGRGHHDHVKTAGPRSKFGISVPQLGRLARLVDSTGVRVVGLHAHSGSGILTPDNWREVALFLAQVASEFPTVRYLDLGGGLGVPEQAGQAPLDLAALDASLRGVRDAHPGFELWLEPGRFLVASAGVLLATVTQLKTKGDLTYVGVDTGMNSLIRPALYGAWHEIVNLTRLGEAHTVVATVVGPICESGDTLGRGRRLPATREGDVLLIGTAGAYGRAMSSRYNLREPAEEVFLT